MRFFLSKEASPDSQSESKDAEDASSRGSAGDRHEWRTDSALTVSKLIFEMTEQVMKLSGIPGAEGVMSAAVKLLDIVQKSRANTRAAKDVVDTIDNLVKTVTDAKRESDASAARHTLKSAHSVNASGMSALDRALNSLVEELSQVSEEAQHIAAQRRIKRMTRHEHNATNLQRMKDGIDRACNKFKMDCEIRMAKSVDLIKEWVIDQNDQDALNRIPHSKHATFDSAINKTKNGYMPGTRMELIEQVMDWATSDEPVPRLFILSGAAGTGKSTIAYELAKRLKVKNRLGASFFFVRGDADLSCTDYVFPTIAYQLAHFEYAFCSSIVEGCRTFPTEGDQFSLEGQCKDLLVDPLSNISGDHCSVVVIIDALDECTELGFERIPRMLYLLLDALLQLPFPLRVLLTTRPELYIEDVFASKSFSSLTNPVRLEEIPRQTVDSDIRLFISESIGGMSRSDFLLESHPHVIDDLTRRADGLFIYAMTVIRILRANPNELSTLIDSLLSTAAPEDTVALHELDVLYLTVLRSAFPIDGFLELLPHSRNKIYMQQVLAVLAVAQDHLSPSTMSLLLGIPISNIRSILSRLPSVVFSKLSDDTEPIRPLHTSFPQFLVASHRCRDPLYYIDPQNYHCYFATACLQLLVRTDGFRRNILQLRNPMLATCFIRDLPAQLDRYIPLHIRYACVHLHTHLAKAKLSPELRKELLAFCTTKLLVWIEAICYLRDGDNAAKVLARMRDWCQAEGDAWTAQMFYDAYRLVLSCLTIITEHPGQLYTAGLAFAPSCLLQKTYSHEESVTVVSPRSPHWSPLLRKTGIKNLKMAKVSPNGRFMVTTQRGSITCTNDAETGSLINSMYGHNSQISCIDVTSDSALVLSSSLGILVWDAASGALVNKLETVNDCFSITSVTAFACSPVLGSRDVAFAAKYRYREEEEAPILGIWDMTNGSCRIKVQDIPQMSSIAFSQDGEHLVTCSNDGKVYWLDTSPSWIGRIPFDNTHIFGAQFIRDNAHVMAASSSEDKLYYVELDIKEKAMKSEKTTTHHHATPLVAYAFCARRNWIATSTELGIYIWDLDSKEQLHFLYGGITIAESLSFTPDGSRLVSVSSGVLCIWDLEAIANRTSRVMGAAGPLRFAPDGTRLAAFESGHIVHYKPNHGCSPATDSSQTTNIPKIMATHHYDNWVAFSRIKWPERPNVMAYSPNNRLFAAARGQIVRLWSMVDQSMIGELTHTMPPPMVVRALDFSPDSQRLFARFLDDSGKMGRVLWSCATKELLENSQKDWRSDERRYRFSPTFHNFVLDGWTGRFILSCLEVQHSKRPWDCWGDYYALGLEDNHVIIFDLGRAAANIDARSRLGMPCERHNDQE